MVRIEKGVYYVRIEKGVYYVTSLSPQSPPLQSQICRACEPGVLEKPWKCKVLFLNHVELWGRQENLEVCENSVYSLATDSDVMRAYTNGRNKEQRVTLFAYVGSFI
jgi:hypothetical protein